MSLPASSHLQRDTMAKKLVTKQQLRQQGEESKRIGRLAEKDASLRFTQAGLSVNRSEEDDQGWDLFLQFPDSTAITSFLDFAPPELSCLLQLKATMSADKDVRMTLRNALKLAKYPGPAFVLF